MTRYTRCIVHAGTHKTATTTVQNLLHLHRAELAASGFFYPAMGPKCRDHNPLAHRLATCTDDDLASVRDALTGRSARAGVRLGGEARLLLSAEEFSTRICKAHAWAEFDDGAYWEQRRRYLARLRQVLPQAAEVEVFVCFRDHESYAHALYATKVLSGKVDWGFAEFVRRCAPIFDYRRQVEVLAQALGPVRVESYEHLHGDLANRVFGWLGLPIRVETTPRLRPTPTLDLIYWLATAEQSQAVPAQRKQRAAFCRACQAKPGGAAAGVASLWQSAQDRQDFLRQCHAPPLEGWPQMPAAGKIADPAFLAHRAEEIEAEYRQWLQTPGGGRKHWLHFWRRST
jgi:hypothetical protein